MTITHPEITVDKANQLPHGTVRRAPEGFAHAILLDQMGEERKWHIIDLYGPMETETDRDVNDWPIVYVPAPDEVWRAVNRQPMTVAIDLSADPQPVTPEFVEEMNRIVSRPEKWPEEIEPPFPEVTT